MSSSRLFSYTYRFLTGEEDEARACLDIPEEACREAPRSFVLNVLNGACTKLAEQLASPGLVLPWLFGTLGASAALTGWLVPVKQVGSLLPQLFVAGYLRAFARRKWFWFAAGTTQAMTLMLMFMVAVSLPASIACVLMVFLLLLFSIASGVGSVAFSDVVGKTVPKGRRGRMLASRATVGGALALGAGLLMRDYLGDADSITPYLMLLMIAAALWLVGAVLFACIPEVSGATQGGRNGIASVLSGFSILRDDGAFRTFVIARCFLLGVELVMPFLVLHTRGLENVDGTDLGIFVIAVSLSSLISAPVWGAFADLAAQRVLAMAGALGALAIGGALLIGTAPSAWQNPYAYGAVFVILGIAEGGARLGRKTYQVDIAPPGEKGTYKAVSNTVAGVAALAAGGLGFIASATGGVTLLVALATSTFVGAAVAWVLPSADRVDVEEE